MIVNFLINAVGVASGLALIGMIAATLIASLGDTG
jgi:hypothetical protein